MAGCHWRLGRRDDALAVCAEGRRFYPDDAELLFREAGFREELGDEAGAEMCWRRLIEGREGAHFASVGAGLRGYLARHRLALLCLRRGAMDEAESHWKAALAERSDFAEARRGFGGDRTTSAGRLSTLILRGAWVHHGPGCPGVSRPPAARVRIRQSPRKLGKYRCL